MLGSVISCCAAAGLDIRYIIVRIVAVALYSHALSTKMWAGWLRLVETHESTLLLDACVKEWSVREGVRKRRERKVILISPKARYLVFDLHWPSSTCGFHPFIDSIIVSGVVSRFHIVLVIE
jgi:hypothetical protein